MSARNGPDAYDLHAIAEAHRASRRAINASWTRLRDADYEAIAAEVERQIGERGPGCEEGDDA